MKKFYYLPRTIVYLLCPLLFSIYPVLFIYSYNVEIVKLQQLVFPLLFVGFFALILFCFFKLILKDNAKASFTSTLFIIIFMNYDLFYKVFNCYFNLRHWHIMPLLLFIFGHLIFFMDIINKKINLENINKVLCIAISFLILFNLFTLFPAEIQKHTKTLKETENLLINYNNLCSNNYPDIYLLILDEYARLDTIKKEWRYQNDDFVKFLKEKEFFIAENSSFRYAGTLWNMSSLLNLNYITEPVEQHDFLEYAYNSQNSKGSEIYDKLNKISPSKRINLINNNLLVRYLKERGYQIIVLEGISQYYSTFNIENADITFSYQNTNKVSDESKFIFFNIDAFNMELLKKTMIFPFEMFVKISETGDINYDGTKYIFNYLKSEVYNNKSPKFIYAHIMCPHPPFVFDKEGNYNYQPTNVFNAYLEQYIFVTEEVKKSIEEILDRSTSKPIIIIQSDHGPRHHHINIKDPTESFKAFNAIYFPNKDYKTLHDSIAPVNTLRVMLNQYFNENFEMLEEK